MEPLCHSTIVLIIDIPRPTEGKDKVEITVEKDGKEESKTEVPITPLTDAERNEPKVPEKKVEVENQESLTEAEKNKIKEEVEKENPELPDGTNIEVDDKGNVTITYPDGSKDTIPGRDVVKGKDTPVDPTEASRKELEQLVDKAEKTKEKDKYKNADKDRKEAFDKALDDAKKVLDKNDASHQELVDAKKKLEDALNKLNGLVFVPVIDRNDNNDKPVTNDKNLPNTGVDTGMTLVSAIVGAIGVLLVRKHKDEE